MISRTLSDRLAAVRTKAQASSWSAPAADDRTALLARWFDARTQVVEGGGTALVVERSVAVTARVAQALAPLPAAAYFDTETTGLSTGAGTVIFMAGVARIDGARVEPAREERRPVVRRGWRPRGCLGLRANGGKAVGEGAGDHADMPASSSLTVALPRAPTSMAGPTHAGQPSAHAQESTAWRQARTSSSTSVKSRSVSPTPPGTAS